MHGHRGVRTEPHCYKYTNIIPINWLGNVVQCFALILVYVRFLQLKT